MTRFKALVFTILAAFALVVGLSARQSGSSYTPTVSYTHLTLPTILLV